MALRSKRGGHLWIFLDQPLLAKIFPKHDILKDGEFGNAIRGPLGIHRGANRRFWFYGAEYTLEAQVGYLKGLRRVTEDELHRFIAGKTMPANFVPAAQEPRLAQSIQSGRHTAIFRHPAACWKSQESRPELCHAMPVVCGGGS